MKCIAQHGGARLFCPSLIMDHVWTLYWALSCNDPRLRKVRLCILAPYKDHAFRTGNSDHTFNRPFFERRCEGHDTMLLWCKHKSDPFPLKMCSTSRELLIVLLVSSCYCFGARGAVSAVYSIAPLKGIEPFM